MPDSAAPEAAPPASITARTHREVLSTVGIDADSPVERLRRLLCRPNRFRTIVLLVGAAVVLGYVVTSRTAGAVRYAYVPIDKGPGSQDDSDEQVLQSRHWTHFRSGAPILVEGLPTVVFRQNSTQSTSVRGGERYLNGVARCLANPTQHPHLIETGEQSGPTAAAKSGGFDDDGFPLRVDAAHVIEQLEPGAAERSFRLQALRPLFAKDFKTDLVSRGASWNRLVFVLSNVSGGAAGAPMRCLASYRASAMAYSPEEGAWYATHGGTFPAERTSHISIATPLAGIARRESDFAADVPRGNTVHPMTRLDLLFDRVYRPVDVKKENNRNPTPPGIPLPDGSIAIEAADSFVRASTRRIHRITRDSLNGAVLFSSRDTAASTALVAKAEKEGTARRAPAASVIIEGGGFGPRLRTPTGGVDNAVLPSMLVLCARPDGFGLFSTDKGLQVAAE